MTVPAGWVPTHLNDGDELATLGPLYHQSPRAIVTANGVAFTTTAINAWVLRTGGVTLSNGQPVFAHTSVIFLPAGGSRSPVAHDGSASRSSVSTAGKVAVGLGLAGLAAWALKKKRGAK